MLTADKQKRWMAIGRAVERACEDLPDGYNITIELEQGAGGVCLYLPDTEHNEWDADDFSDRINMAIDFAIEQHIKGGGNG